MSKITLWGFNGSTFVRTVRMLLAEKGVTDYEQVPVNVLKGEPKSPEHRKLHPFGKVPVVEVDGFRVIETPAILRYLDAVLPGPKLVPADPKDAARADTAVSIIDSYGYGPIIGGLVAYHLFPGFVGGKNKDAHDKGLADGKMVLGELMRIKGSSTYLAGSAVSIADLYVAPLLAYVAMTPHKDDVMGVSDTRAWWDTVSGRASFKATQP